MGHRKVCFGSSINIDTLEAANACVPLDQMQCYSTPPSTHGSKHNPVTDAIVPSHFSDSHDSKSPLATHRFDPVDSSSGASERNGAEFEMSLYIGNLSEHSRRDDLERVFRRFGHCNVQLKRNGYGFVVFDFPLDAEKALRALKGRNICGESLTLTWSSKQPSSHFSRIPSGVRRNAYELGHARNAERVGYARRRMGTNGRSNQKMGRGKSVEMAGEERGYCRDDFKDYVGEKKNYEGDFPNEGGGVVPNKEENGGWGEPVHDPLVDNGNGSGIEFDRYEPYQCPDRKHDNEDYHVGYSGGSPAAHSQENVSRALGEDTSNCSNGSKFQQNCFRCGDPGHKMRNCPKEHTSQRKYNSKIVQQNNKIDKKHKSEDENKFESDSLARLQSSVEALSMRHQIDGRRLSGSRHHHAPRRNESSPVTRETDKHNKKEYGGKKRSRNEIELPKQSKAKISKQSVSSSLLSDYSASRFHSNSQSSKSLHRSSSHSRSRSVSSRSYSSSSKSQYCKGKRLNSRRLSSSMPLCVSLNQTLSSSPNKIQLNSKGSSINGTALESVEHLVAQGQQIGSKMELENLQSKDTVIAVNGKAAVYTTVVDDVEKGQFVQEDNHENHFFLKSSGRVTDLNEPLVGNLSPPVEKETKGLEHSGAMMLDNISTEIEKPASETNVNLHSNLSTIVSTEEIRMVLNTYGLELPKDDENNLTIDAVFGCARLWPWHVVYYRRLKKGPISTENYARRVAQNQEFGIVDKYIRSSSGWGEFSLENA
ncbi:Serine/arginine-rich splicing factor 7 [Glycine max]|nr:Serine/arginine-rich splicing factor 7 [Glycine max]KAH1228005.1 Serine/arginine-rich splicing factor 7 [Glycine max]